MTESFRNALNWPVLESNTRRARRRPTSLQAALWSVGSLMIMWSVSAAYSLEPRLELGRPVERSIEPGDIHVFRLRLEAQRFVKIVLLQQAVNLELSLLAPDGAVIESVDGLGGNWLPETLVASTRSAGLYRVTVAAEDHGRAGGRSGGFYELHLEALRGAEPSDEERLSAERALHEGRHLRVVPDQASVERGIESLTRAADTFRSLEEPGLTGVCLSEVGQAHLELGRLDEAREALESALQQSDAVGDDTGSLALAAEASSFLALVLDASGDREGALARHQESLRWSREANEEGLEALALTHLAEFDFGHGRTDDALRQLQAALPLARSARAVRVEAVILLDLGAIARHSGESGKALDNYRAALDLVERLDDAPTEMTLLNNLGVVYRARGQIHEALDAYQRARASAVSMGKRLTEAFAAANLGMLYAVLGNRELAIEHHENALRIHRELGSVRGEGRTLMELGWLWEKWDEPEAAIESYEAALAKSTLAGDRRTKAYTRQGLGRALLSSGATEGVLEHLQNAVELHRESGELTGSLAALRELGAGYRQLGSPGPAAQALAQSLDFATLVGDGVQEAATRSEIARLERSEGHLVRAREQIEASLTQIESFRSGVATPSLRNSFASRSQDEYRFYIALLLELARRDASDGSDRGMLFESLAFRASERARARGLVELLTESGFDFGPGLDPTLRTRRSEIGARLSWLQRQLVSSVGPSGEKSPETTEAVRRELSKVKRSLERLEADIRREHPGYAEIRYPEPIGLEQAQRLIEEETALLEYVLGEDASFLFVVSTTSLSVIELPPEQAVVAVVREFREAATDPGRRSLGRLKRASRQLYELLVRPAESAIGSKERLLIVPDGMLYYLPFEALERDDRSYLLERWSVSYVPSATAFASLDSRAKKRDAREPRVEFVAFADPLLGDGDGDRPTSGTAPTQATLGELGGARWRRLPGTRIEAEAIASLFAPDRTVIYLGPQASEQAVKEDSAVEGAAMLHFASHGLLDEEQPAYSGLMLAHGASGHEDGLLQVHEILDLKLSAELVVLSACDTALGKRVRGEGLVGLTRAFLYAGARAVLVSLWQVEDRSTAELMTGFYRGLHKGLGPTDALRRSKLELLRSRRWAHPYHWAPFTLVGDP